MSGKAVDAVPKEGRNMQQAEHEHVEDEEDECLTVLYADTGADPGTVVVHLDDAAIALTAVMRLGRLDAFTS